MAEYRQDLYFVNLPRSHRTKHLMSLLGFLKSLNKENKLFSDNTNPIFIWTGTGRIEKLEKEYQEKVKNKLRKKTIEIYLYEPICLKINGEYNCSFYSEFKYGVKYNNVISEELESVRIFKKLNNFTNVKIFTSDYNLEYLKILYPDLELYCLDSFLRHVTLNERSSTETNKIRKKFWCGNWRYTAHRHLIMSYLIHLDGNFSWNLKCSFEDLKRNVWFDLDQLKDQDPDKFYKIKKGVDILNENILRIDTKIDQVTVENISEVYIPGHNSPSHSDTFLNSYKECFCAVINETRFAQPFGYFSEKTTTAIESKLPIILVAPPRTLEYLKTFGFKTFDRWWDESYDQEEDHEKRLLKIFDIIDYINSKSFEELQEIYNEMESVLEHNTTVVKTIPYNKDAL